MLLTRIVSVVFVLAMTEGMPPIGYKTIQQSNENPPKYEYQYDIKSEKGVGQGKTEIREGIQASGRYYVAEQNSSQNVEYVADKWGYHPYVEFQNIGPYSQTVTQIALDKEAIKMLNKKNNKDEVVNRNEGKNYSPAEANYNKIELRILDNKEKEVQVQENQNEHVQAYIPISEPTLIPQTDYVYLNQNPKYLYAQNEQSDAKNTVLLQPILYDQVVSVTPTIKLQNEPQQQNQENYETVSPFKNPKNFDYYESEYGSKIYDQVQKRPLNVRTLFRFKDMVSGQDVLDINTAVNTKHERESQTSPELTPPEPKKNASNEHSLFDHPIIVGDAESLNENCENLSELPTIIVTPKPINNALLAPLTATVKLRPVTKTLGTKAIHENYVVDVQRSIPFYLGKIEYYDSLQPKEKNFTAVATQHIQLGDLLQQPIVEKPKKVPVITKPPSANFSKTIKSEITKDESLQHLDNSKYVAQETKLVENPVLLPVQLQKDVSRASEISVVGNQPLSMQHSMQATFEKKEPVLQYVETPVPVEIPGDHFVQKPYPTTVQVPAPAAQAFYLPIELPKPYPVQVARLIIPTAYSFHATPAPNKQIVVESAKVTKLLPNNKNAKRLKNQETPVYTNNFQIYNKISCIDLRLFGVHKPYCPKINNNHYIGLVPPKIQAPRQYNATNNVVKKRTAREGLLDNIRWEYGFMPPLIPSLAIDEHGNPIDKHTK